MRRLLIAILLLLQFVCLTVAVSSWWAGRNNHLFGNGHWLIGKDQGKYVFYAFDFMFAPLDERGVNLARDQGFQEILYHRPEGETRRLRSLAFDTAFEAGTYLWIILQKEGNGGICARFSRNQRYPEGFFEFDQRGFLVRHQPFEQTIVPQDRWSRIRVERTPEGISLYRNDTKAGSFQTTSPPGGYFGFRGSGRARTAVHVRNVEMVFEHPGQPGKTWTVSEHLGRQALRTDLLLAGACMALLAIGLRVSRAALLCGYLARERRSSFLLADLAGFTAACLVVLFLPGSTSGLKIPLAVAAAELWTVVMLRLARRKAVAPEPSRGRAPLFVALCLVILLAAVYRHGPWLGRSTRSVDARMERIDPRAYIVVPDPSLPATPFSHEEPLDLHPGQPFFVDTAAYREQAVTLTFTMAEACTLDVVLQQQAYRTRGDPRGEDIPLQRRLVRFSTVRKVTGGVAGGTHRNPMPPAQCAGRLPGRTPGRFCLPWAPLLRPGPSARDRFPAPGGLRTGPAGLLRGDHAGHGARRVSPFRAHSIHLARRGRRRNRRSLAHPAGRPRTPSCRPPRLQPGLRRPARHQPGPGVGPPSGRA